MSKRGLKPITTLVTVQKDVWIQRAPSEEYARQIQAYHKRKLQLADEFISALDKLDLKNMKSVADEMESLVCQPS
jgi:hypothetical protein